MKRNPLGSILSLLAVAWVAAVCVSYYAYNLPYYADKFATFSVFIQAQLQ